MKLKLWLTAAIIAVWMLLITASCQGGVAFDLTWTSSVDSNRVVGYTIYWGPTNALPFKRIVGTNMTASVSNLQAGVTYQFWVTCQDANEQESEPSPVIHYTVPLPPPPQPPNNLRIILETSQNTSGPWISNRDFGIVQLMTDSQRFYRTRMEIDQP